jgi:hypothetical protein
LRAVGFPESELETADRIMFAESRCRLEAINTADVNGGSWCFFQVNRFWEDYLIGAGVMTEWETIIADPAVCAGAALVIFNRSGWNPWATY